MIANPTEAICPKCGRVQMISLEKREIKIINNGVTFSFVPDSDISFRCKRRCGYVGTWLVEQLEWETSISRG